MLLVISRVVKRPTSEFTECEVCYEDYIVGEHWFHSDL